jgi:hypothetical protein
MHDAASTLTVLLLGLGVMLAGVVLVVNRGSLRSRLRRTPRTLARQARAGSTVKMIGRVVVREPVHAPLADVACAYFQMTVQEQTQREDGDHRLETQFTDKQYAQGWELEDESGRIAVQPENARFLYLRLREYNPDSAAWDPNIRQDLVSRYILTRSADGTKLSEERLELGKTVVVLGRVEQGPSGPVLTGGHELEVYGEDERKLTALKLADLAGWVLVLTGLLLCATWASVLSQPPEPLPNTQPMPIPRPSEPPRSTPRNP